MCIRDRLETAAAMSMIRQLEAKAEIINGIRFISGIIDTDSADMLKSIAYQLSLIHI